MKKEIKQLLFSITIFVFLLSTLTGCWNARELNALSIVAGIGIDKARMSDEVLLTAQIVKPGEMRKPSKEAAGGEGTAFWNLQSSARTVFDAFRQITHETSNRLYLSHTQAIIFGKDAASDGVRKYLDFFMRSHETRPTAMILVSSSTAAEVMDVKPEIEKLPAINMAKLAKSQSSLTAHAIAVNLQDFTASLLGKTTSPVAPLVTIRDKDRKKTLHVEGMVVFKGDKLTGTLDSAETRGLLWIRGKVEGGVIVVDFPGGNATLEITKAESIVTPEIRNGKPYIHVMIKEDSNLVNQTNPENLTTVSGFSKLKQQQNEAIRSEIQAAVKKAKDLNADIFAFGEKFHKKYRKEWGQMEESWDKIFPTIQIDVEVESKIRAAGLIIKPAAPGTSSGEE